MWVASVGPEECPGAFDINAELCFFGTGGCKSMRVRINIGIDTECAFTGGIAFLGDARDVHKFIFALNVKEVDVRIKGSCNFIIALANAGIDDRGRRRTGRTRTEEFATRDNIHARSAFHQGAAHR